MGRVNGILWRKKQSRLKYSKVRGWVMAHGLFYYYCFLLFLPKTNAEYWWSDDDKKWYIVYFLAWKNYCKQLSFSPYASLSHWHLSMNLVFIFLHPRPSISQKTHHHHNTTTIEHAIESWNKHQVTRYTYSLLDRHLFSIIWCS